MSTPHEINMINTSREEALSDVVLSEGVHRAATPSFQFPSLPTHDFEDFYAVCVGSPASSDLESRRKKLLRK